MTSHKQIEKSLKRPDSFQDHVLKGIRFVTTNKQRVALMASPILLVAAIGYGAFAWNNHQSASRRADLAKILITQNDEQTDVGKKREELQKQIDALRTTKPGPDGKKAEVSAESLTKVTLLEKQMGDLKPDQSKSTAAYKAFYDAHKDTTEGWMAGLTWAGRQLQENKIADARPVIEAISKASTANKFYQMSSRQMLIGILEDANEFDAALKECDILSSLASDEAKPGILLAKGRIQYFKKSFSEARTVLNEIVDKHASSPEATKARSLIAAMGPA